MAVPIDGGQQITLATMLPPQYPATGAQSPSGNAQVVVGPKRIFWAECWGNGGAATDGSGRPIINWVLRAVAPGTGEEPQVIDSFTWDAHAATFGSCPRTAADHVGVYWTHEGALMRMCA